MSPDDTVSLAEKQSVGMQRAVALQQRASLELLGRREAMPNGLLALQRTAGNASVNRMMLQRQSVGDSGSLGSSGPQKATSTTTETLAAFVTGSAELTPSHLEALTRIAADLNAQPLVFGGYVRLVGGTDHRGDAGENQALGQDRADAVRGYLQDRVTDETTRQQIRAYSIGELEKGRGGDVAGLRKVEITITRRSYNLGLPTPTPTIPGPSGTPLPPAPDLPRVPRPPMRDPHLPDWLWRQLPPGPPESSVVSEISRWLSKALDLRDIARVAASVAASLGFNSAQVRQFEQLLMDAFEDGGESAVKKLLEVIMKGIDPPSHDSPPTPDGPEVEEIPFLEILF